jgi:dsRNA-specific ribonuclease
LGEGKGRSKKAAEQAAAKQAFLAVMESDQSSKLVSKHQQPTTNN